MPNVNSTLDRYYQQNELKPRNVLDRIYEPIDNYIYLYHTNTFLVIPSYPASLQDSTSANFSSTSILGRSAPVFSYSGSGPRTISFQFDLHREMMQQFNTGISNAEINTEVGDDYIDYFIKAIQAAALPRYSNSTKMIDPPMVAVRICNDELYIKGVVNGSVNVGYSGPILKTNKFAQVSVGFTVTEVDPYDAEMVMSIGSYRNSGDIIMNTTLDSDIYSVQGTGANKKSAYNTSPTTITRIG